MAHNNLGIALYGPGRLDEAAAAYHRALRGADFAEPYSNLANVEKDRGRLDDALACLRKAVALKPEFARAASNLLFLLHYHPDYD